MHNWTVKKVYYYGGSLILLIMILVIVGNLTYSVVQVAVRPPQPTPTWNYEDAARQLMFEKYGKYEMENATVTPDEVAAWIERKRQESRKTETYYTMQNLLRNLLYLAVVVPTYWYHWKVARTLE